MSHQHEATRPQPHEPSVGWAGRWTAVAEVCLAFGVMHLGFRLIKRFTSWGRWESETGMNFAPGLVMIVVAVAMIGLRRARAGRDRHEQFRDLLAAYGLRARPLFPSLADALLAVLILGLLGAALVASGVPITQGKSVWSVALLTAAANLCATWLLLSVLRRKDAHPWGRARPVLRAGGALVLVSILSAPILLAILDGEQARPFDRQLLTVLWIVIGAGFGEEIFFRGYVQSRLNQAFGRPWSLLGVPFGAGLLLTSALFGLVHLLNPYDYFGLTGGLSWRHALMTLCTLYFGFLRERTGSILAPALVHALTDLGGRASELMGGGLG